MASGSNRSLAGVTQNGHGSDRRARILVTDDRVEMLQGIELVLGELYQCEFAASVGEAREQLRGGSFDLALCDVNAAGEPALALVEEIVAARPETAVVLVTEEDDPFVANRAFDLGVHGYLVEPLQPGQLLITVMNALRSRDLEIASPLVDDLAKITVEGGISLDTSFQRDAVRLRDELASAQRKAIGELRLSREETVERLVRAIEHHDITTGQHINRIGRVAAFLATLLGLEPHWVELLRIAAPMHDVGKIGTRPEILRKPGPLSPEERAEMQLHTLIGHEILCDSKSELLRMAASVALTHHERYDGSGYPHGLTGYEIPIAGRITAVADVFDALLSDRHYRPAMPIEEAVALIEEGRDTQFDPRVVDLLLGHVDEAISIRA